MHTQDESAGNTVSKKTSKTVQPKILMAEESDTSEKENRQDGSHRRSVQ